MARTIKLNEEEVIAVQCGDAEILIDSTSGILTVWTSEPDDEGITGTMFSKVID